MPHKFTKAERARAVEVRLKNATDKKLKAQQQAAGTATTEITASQADSGNVQLVTTKDMAIATDGKTIAAVIIPKTVFDWWNAPLDVAVNELNERKREYDRASQIVLQRTSKVPQVLHCWTVDHAKLVSKQTFSECKKKIADAGKAAFINNGHREPGDPSGQVRTIYCCSMKCFMAYQQSRPITGLSRH